MPEWTIQRVEQLAPDAAAVKAASGVAKPAKWRNVGTNSRVLWGECQGSGAQPYQVRVDLEDVAYKCSCPSRKLPCKHTLGLLLLLASGAEVPQSTPPGFVEEWIANRARRAEAKAARQTAPDRPPDREAQAKRAQQREARIEAGLEQLEAWLEDIMLQGLAAARAQPQAFWNQMSARLVDAQAPGLARRVGELAQLAVAGTEWQTALLSGLARLQLIVDAYRRQEVLPAELVAEVRNAVGWTQSQESLLEREGVRDRWMVVGRRQTESDKVRTQHTWLMGQQSGQVALILEFAVGNQPLPVNFSVGQTLDAELVFYDGTPRLRALIKTRFASADPSTRLPFPRDTMALQTEYAKGLAANPWLERWPTTLGPVTPSMQGTQCVLVDASGRELPVRQGFPHAWHLVALASGEPIVVFGEWDGRAFDPISAEHRDALYVIASLGELPVLSRVA